VGGAGARRRWARGSRRPGGEATTPRRDTDAYFTSPHYSGYPAIQIRLESIDRDELRERLEDAWLIQAPKRLSASYMTDAD
jgi:hypothetical protein